MKVLQVNSIDYIGNIFNGYDYSVKANEKKEVTSEMIVINRKKTDEFMHEITQNSVQADMSHHLFQTESEILSSIGNLSITSSFLYDSDIYKQSDIIHYHHLHNTHLSLQKWKEKVKSKPSVITFHDPWYMTGRCVHPEECQQWKKGCKKCPDNSTLFELPFSTCDSLWKQKKEIYQDLDLDIIVASPFMKKMIEDSDLFQNKTIHVVPFGIDIKQFDFDITKQEARELLSIPEDHTVLFFREQKELKGTEYIVEALKQLKTTKKITLLTNGGLGLLDEIADQYNIVELGPIPYDKTLLAFNACDIFLMPSKGESFGMMAIEAMAASKPVVVFDNTSLPEVSFAPECGILVKNKDSKDLLEKIDWIINNEEEQIKRGKLGRQLVEKHYLIDSYVKKITEIYHKAYNRQKYKLNLEEKEAETNVEIKYNSKNIKNASYKLKTIFKRYFPYDELPTFLTHTNDKYLLEETINFADAEVSKLFELFNNDFYERSKKLTKKTMKKYVVGNPLVTIVIPVYNGSNYVKEAINSALNQTYKNIEIIVVNDGSNDNGKTSKTLKKLVKKHPEIKYYEKENGGVSTALNVALENMNGEYFSWLSHDDKYYPTKIEEQIKKILTLPKNTILYSDYSLMDEKSNIYLTVKLNHEELMKKMEYALYRGCFNGITTLIPVEAFIKYKGFNENQRCVQDYDKWYDMMKTYNFVHMDIPLGITRIHSQQVTNTNPKVITEGNELWTRMVSEISEEKMIELEGSVLSFKEKMIEFLKETPYDKTRKYLEKEVVPLLKEESKMIDQIKISIIINYVDDKKMMMQTLDSISKQTHQNYEIILITKEKNNQDNIKKLISKYKIQVVEHIDIKEMIEKLLKIATGKYICFYKHHENLQQNKVRKQLIELERSNKELLLSDIMFSNCKTKIDFIDKVTKNQSFDKSSMMIKKAFLANNAINHYDNDIIFCLEILKNIDFPIHFEDKSEEILNLQSNIPKIETVTQVLKYFLNDPYYCKYDNQIAYLSKKIYEKSSIYQETKIHYRPISMVKYIKDNGIIYIMKKTYNKTPMVVRNKTNKILRPTYQWLRKVKNAIKK